VRQQVAKLLSGYAGGDAKEAGEAPADPGMRLSPEGFRSTPFGESP
jgi:hypothetical protein